MYKLESEYLFFVASYMERNQEVLIRQWEAITKPLKLPIKASQEVVTLFISNMKQVSQSDQDIYSFLEYFSPPIFFNYRLYFESILELLAQHDQETTDHQVRTACYSMITAEYLGCNQSYVKRINESSPFHDVGKITIPVAILHKRGRLSVHEMNIIRLHAPIGAAILKFLNFDEFTVLNTLLHHERFDQNGYLGMPLDDIPLCASIVKLADVYDALISKRCYKPAYSHYEAKQIIQESRGEFFPEVLDVFSRNHKKYAEIANDVIGVMQ